MYTSSVLEDAASGVLQAGNNMRVGQMLQTYFGAADSVGPALEYFKLTVGTAVRHFRERFDVSSTCFIMQP
jgi:hypothetical protein